MTKAFEKASGYTFERICFHLGDTPEVGCVLQVQFYNLSADIALLTFLKTVAGLSSSVRPALCSSD